MTVFALIRARDEVAGIGPLLDRLRGQSVRVEVVVIDSGSTDGTVEAVRSRGVEPLRMEAGAFTYGRALNRAAAAASGDVLVAICEHALPPDEDWAQHMAGARRRPRGVRVRRAAGARPPAAARAAAAGPGARGAVPVLRLLECGGGFRRALWERRPFDEALAASEDKEWAWHWLSEGMLVRLDPALAVHHSHADEGPLRTFRRARGDFAATRAFRPVPRVPAGAALLEWWRGPDAHASALRARLDPRRAAMLAGKWAALR